MTAHFALPRPEPTRLGPVLVFDSGVGGLTVLDAIRDALPGLDLVFLADDAGFPYGAWAEDALVARVVSVLAEAIEAVSPEMVVIACNTASTLVLPSLRARFPLPFVGTVPAIKPAVAATRSGLISVLGTPGTVTRDYTRALVADHAAGVEVTLVGATGLAAIAEAKLAGLALDWRRFEAEIAPAFVARDSRRTDAIALACTHYPLLLPELEKAAPWPVLWIDPAPAIARRVASLLEPRAAAARAGAPRPGRALFTSGRRPPPTLEAALESRGLALAAPVE